MAPMNTMPRTPPQSVANCWTAVEKEASGGEKAVTRVLSAREGDRCSRGQAHLDAQATEFRVLQAQLAVVERHLLGDDRQAEPGALRRRDGPAGERLEQALALGRVDPRAVVVDAQHDRVAVAHEPQADVPARATVQRGVVEQVVDEQAQAAAPALERDLGNALCELVLDVGAAAAGGVQRLVDEVAELDVLARQALGRVAARERLEALEQVDDAL